MTLNEINLDTEEGKLLMGALVVLTTSPGLTDDGKTVNGRQMTPDECISLCRKAYSYTQETVES